MNSTALERLAAFATDYWSSTTSVQALVAAYNSAQTIALNAEEQAVIARALLTQGKTLSIDFERIKAEQLQLKTLRIYQHNILRTVVDAETLIEQSADLGDYREVVATDGNWYPVELVLEHMDVPLLEELQMMYWPGIALMLNAYRALHLAKFGEAFSVAGIAASLAAKRREPMVSAATAKIAKDLQPPAPPGPGGLSTCDVAM